LVSAASVPSDLILTKERQKEKIAQWDRFWDRVGRERLELLIKQEDKHFSADAFRQFFELLNRKFEAVPVEEFSVLRNSFLGNYISYRDGSYSVVSILKVDKKNKDALFEKFESDNSIVIFDKQYFSNRFFEVLKDDFDKLVLLSMVIVFAILLISFGRIELAVITFFPITLSWLWTLGLMGLFGIKFNIFNIIISTFILGLGIDYSIFIMRGMLNNYKYCGRSLTPYKLSVLLSVITTILGIGVLIFAKHPALKSIAVVTIFGILSVVIISYTVLPLLFSVLTMHKGKRRREPLTLLNSFISVFSLVLLIVMAFVLTAMIPVIYLIPLPRKHIKYLFSVILSYSSRFIVWINFTIKKVVINIEKADFSTPSVIVSNHQSHLDLVLLLRLHPKLIVITNKWVWNNPIYGFIIRFADFYPIYKGLDSRIDKLKKKVSEGYSIIVFPEGSRTPDGSIKRFHQGAFKLADELGIEITPVLIHGAYQCLPKTEFFMRSGKITQKFFDRVKVTHADPAKNETYRLQAKQLAAFMRNEYKKLSLQTENTDFYRKRLENQYIFKGPVLEWYVRIKLKLENNYRLLNDLIPLKAKIVDIGCGYGYLDHLLRYVSNERVITGIDYDKEKIDVANCIEVYDKGINFYEIDVTEEEIPHADVYILNDVLHYMPQELQLKVLNSCFDKVSGEGMVIVRDADADLEKRTRVTKATEIQSTKIFKFNKTRYDLTFISGKIICEAAASRGFSCERIDTSKHTSNITYVFRHEKQV
jgi:1-acyl-sn-glycerol-3-phosphate acyltransferase